jgi:hypothetical protein
MSRILTLILLVAASAMPERFATAGPHTACTDCPLPPPCAAEGGCYPKRDTWGYYPNQWNRWPTDYGDDVSAAPGEKSVLPSVIVPTPALEDKAAPAPSEPKPEDAGMAPGGGARELDLPSLPPLPGAPGVPGQPVAPPQPGANQPEDAPPGLPPLPGFGLPPGISPPPRPAGGPGQTSTKGRGTDAPPPLPMDFAKLLRPTPQCQPMPRATPAGYQQSDTPPVYRSPTPAPAGVVPAYYDGSAR